MSKFKNNLSEQIQTPKKFVFQIYPENIDYIESLPYRKKNNLINQLLDNYKFYSIEKKKNDDLINLLKKIAITLLLIVICIPLLIMLVNFSFEVTKNSYSKMERNFEKLFK